MPPTGIDVLHYELQQERASTLGEATRRFEAALSAFKSFDGAEEQRASLRDAAGEALWRFVIQREACGLRNTEQVMRDYAVPWEVRLRMGVRPQT